ncbi:hypothetical protein [Tateyamaria sp. SN6-1]|uniref:hypothetical protein n=1 Tax=Tateyamaria sp. SN6-1 TaxID=3092148 RepID=UPI0039F543E5
MRTLTPAWLKAEEENKAQRNALRKAFWADLGITPVSVKDASKSTSTDRTGAYQKVWAMEDGAKEIDGNIRDIAAKSKALILSAGLSRGPAAFTPKIKDIDLSNLSTEMWRQFFMTDASSAFEASRFIKRGK